MPEAVAASVAMVPSMPLPTNTSRARDASAVAFIAFSARTGL